ncbi:Predicted transglutaminase-like cysteine proteinase [Marivita hallyeonensis]|uniref:Predicted transglutaminase-like cysteine proteinase n=2 Tax=Marivita hallyeonensis TaxID=996342 RepID=A0A1M5TBH9_9RHOB|nr:Predicted transglutaminase-like cysteine proteinase [Marivita hallyeonensis]
MTARTRSLQMVLAAGVVCLGSVAQSDAPRCMSMRFLPIAGVETAPGPYQTFCDKVPDACVLDGEDVIEWTDALYDSLSAINAEVNREIRFVPDQERLGVEERWDFPVEGVGDCEDFVLEKRRRLIDLGVPSAALTCGIAVHQVQLFPHAVLLVETSIGTFVLDNLEDEVMCWDALPYLYLLRERTDGLWDRFQLQ